jgi:ribosomal RNA-processing protein 8
MGSNYRNNKPKHKKKHQNEKKKPRDKYAPSGKRPVVMEKKHGREKGEKTPGGSTAAPGADPFPFDVSSGSSKVKKGGSIIQEMEAKLAGAKFRLVNENLYTIPGSAAQKLFKEEPSLFDDVCLVVLLHRCSIAFTTN